MTITHKHKTLRETLREVKFLSRMWFFVKKFRCYKPHRQIRNVKTIERGNYCCSFSFVPEILSSKPIVYSFGVGFDVSFDLALIHEFGAEVYAFDPTPKSLEWVQKNVNDNNFHLYPIGISFRNGSEKFYISGGLGTTMQKNQASSYITVQMKTLSTIMHELGHDYIDILKIDIEGTEFAVIPEILASRVKFGQLSIEVHNRFYSDGNAKIKDLIAQLNNAGFYIVSVSPNYEELTFVRK